MSLGASTSYAQLLISPGSANALLCGPLPQHAPAIFLLFCVVFARTVATVVEDLAAVTGGAFLFQRVLGTLRVSVPRVHAAVILISSSDVDSCNSAKPPVLGFTGTALAGIGMPAIFSCGFLGVSFDTSDADTLDVARLSAFGTICTSGAFEGVVIGVFGVFGVLVSSLRAF